MSNIRQKQTRIFIFGIFCVCVGIASMMRPNPSAASVLLTAIPKSISTSVSRQIGYVQLSASTTPTGWVDIPNSDLSITVPQSSTVLISYAGSVWAMMNPTPSSAIDVLLTFNLDGVDRTDLVTADYEASWASSVGLPDPAIAPVSFTVPVTVPAGTHVVKLREQLWGVWNIPNATFGIGYNNRASTLSLTSLP